MIDAVFSGIIFINRNGLRWRDAPNEHGTHKTLYNRWKRWRDRGMFAQMMAGLAAEQGEEKTVMIPSHRLLSKRLPVNGPRLRWRLVQGSVERQRDTRLYPWPEAAREGREVRQRRDKRRNRIMIMLGRLKDWRCLATRYDRCPKVFLSDIALAATVIDVL